MSKILTIILVFILVIIIILGGWWLFSRTNSETFQPSNTNIQQGSAGDQANDTNSQPNGNTATTQGSDKSIVSFIFSGLTPEVDGVIDYDNYTINLSVPIGTDLTSLTPTISIPADATVSPLSGVAQDFTNPITYTVTSQDGSTQSYTVTVTPVSD